MTFGDDLCLTVDEALWQRRDERLDVVGLVGGKALGLASLHAAGLNVPAAVVIPTSVYWDTVQVIGLRRARKQGASGSSPCDPAAMRAEFDALELSADLAEALKRCAARLGESLAVRSSAVVEDAAEAAWPGQFTSVLGVQAPAIPRSVIRCWASLFGTEAVDYARRLGVDICTVAMAVVIQGLVRARWAGVLVTGKTASGKGDDNVIYVEAVRGLGEPLVSGTTTPELRLEARLNDGVVTRHETLPPRRGPITARPGFPSAAVKGLIEGSRRLQQLHQRRALDIEWAWDGKELWFLQVRPDTSATL